MSELSNGKTSEMDLKDLLNNTDNLNCNVSTPTITEEEYTLARRQSGGEEVCNKLRLFDVDVMKENDFLQAIISVGNVQDKKVSQGIIKQEFVEKIIKKNLYDKFSQKVMNDVQKEQTEEHLKVDQGLKKLSFKIGVSMENKDDFISKKDIQKKEQMEGHLNEQSPKYVRGFYKKYNNNYGQNNIKGEKLREENVEEDGKKERNIVQSKPQIFSCRKNLRFNTMFNYLSKYYDEREKSKNYLTYGIFLDMQSVNKISGLVQDGEIVLSNHIAIPNLPCLSGNKAQCTMYAQVVKEGFKLVLVEIESISFSRKSFFILKTMKDCQLSFERMHAYLQQLPEDEIELIKREEIFGYIGRLEKDGSITYQDS